MVCWTAWRNALDCLRLRSARPMSKRSDPERWLDLCGAAGPTLDPAIVPVIVTEETWRKWIKC